MATLPNTPLGGAEKTKRRRSWQLSEERRQDFARRRQSQSSRRFLQQSRLNYPHLDDSISISEQAQATQKSVWRIIFGDPASNPRNQKASSQRYLSTDGNNLAFSKGPSSITYCQELENPSASKLTGHENDPLLSGQQPLSPTTSPRRHSFVYKMLSPHSKSWQAIIFKRCISLIIVVDILLFVLSTDQGFLEKYRPISHPVEGFISSLFLLEYLARLATITERPKYSEWGPIWGRWRYVWTTPALIDLLATLPFFLELPTGWNLPTLTYLRAFRLFRILKTEGTVRALDAFYRVFYYNREILYVAVLVCFLMVLVTSVLLYYLRPPDLSGGQSGHDETEWLEFHSIPATMYLSTLLLTGQGGPNDDHLPWYTRAVILATSIFSVAVFAIPASMMTWAWEAEAERLAKKTHHKAYGSGGRDAEDDESDTEGDTTDEEYLKIIAGEDEDPKDEDPLKKALRESFEHADVNADGTLTLAEFVRMQTSGEFSNDNSTSLTALAARVDRLESQLRENAEKLDRIIELLSQQR